MNHHALMETFMERDEALAKCPLLASFLKERPEKRISSEDGPTDRALKKSFVVDEDDVVEARGDDGDDSDEEPDLFDSVCAICDNGGDLLCCEGRCFRSFHATRSAGEDSDCKSLGYTEFEVQAIQNFLCKNCERKQHQCFACGKLGSSDMSKGAEVFCCVNATCGRFYHPKCAAILLYKDNNTEAIECQKTIAAGGTFSCPVHKCVVCHGAEDKEKKHLEFAVCRRCPKSYHRQCLPREITFEKDEEDEEDEDEDIVPRAWEGLLPNRILIYCLDHEIDEELGTPVRNHIKFPEVVKKEKLLDMQKSKLKLSVKTKMQESDSLPKKRTNESGSLPMKLKSQYYDKLPMKKVIRKTISDTEGDSSLTERDRTVTEQRPKFNKNKKLPKNAAEPGLWQDDGTLSVDNKTSLKEKRKPLTSRAMQSSFPAITEETENKMRAMMETTSASITLEDVIRKRTMPSTHVYSKKSVDKRISLGKVEGTVQAVKAALKILEDGGSVEDAKVVCEPEVLTQLFRWNNMLSVYLAPFLHGVRYSSFGRHFTKVDKLMEIVDKMQWYVQNGDTIVDFCCGANDFSRLMKEKLEIAGKKCSFKNYDIIQPMNDFNFEKRDWMTVQQKELPTGSQLIMGLNPPFGFKASLANKFIDKALTFRPKLIILIVPPETERLDKKKTPYDLIWEDDVSLSGKSFYLPGSVDVMDKQIEQWNNTPPLLYLWSRVDWTAKHKAIALKQGHLDDELNKPDDALNKPSLKDARPLEVHETRDVALGETKTESNMDVDRNNRGLEENRRREPQKREKRRRKKESFEKKRKEESFEKKRKEESFEKKRKEEPFEKKRKVDEPTIMSVSPAVHTRSNTPERNQVALPRSGVEVITASRVGMSSASLDEDIDQIAKRYAVSPSRDNPFNNASLNWSGVGTNNLGYGNRSTEERIPSYIRDDTSGRKPFMNDYDGYTRTSELQPRTYGMQGQDDVSQRSRYSLSSSVSASDPPKPYLSSSFGHANTGIESSVMQRYAPRLDQSNYPMPGSSTYDMPGMRRDTPPDLMGFALPPRYSGPGTSGWLDD